jgi:uncharacterized membrane protein
VFFVYIRLKYSISQEEKPMHSDDEGRSVAHSIRKIVIMLLAIFVVVSIFGQQTTPVSQLGDAGGTVNVVLANKNGLVAVTDSRLTDISNKPLMKDHDQFFRAQKLFLFDDHTICTIAGWFSSPWNTQDLRDVNLYFALPNSIHKLVDNVNYLHSKPIEQKMRVLAANIAITRGIIDSLPLQLKSKGESEPSIITMETSEDGIIKIVVAVITQNRSNKEIGYDIQIYPTVNVGEDFKYVVSGFAQTAESELTGHTVSTASALISSESGIGSAHLPLQPSVKAWKSLSISDLTLKATKLALLTAKDFPNAVGEPIQIAVIQNGSAKIVQQDVDPTSSDTLERSIAWIRDFRETSFPPVRISQRSQLPDTAFIFDSYFENMREKLDQRFFFNTQFEHCELVYNGSPLAYFDKSNKIDDCTLILGPGVDENWTLVQKLRENFPQLKLVNSK